MLQSFCTENPGNGQNTYRRQRRGSLRSILCGHYFGMWMIGVVFSSLIYLLAETITVLLLIS